MTKNERIDVGRFHWDRALEKIIDYETCESYYDDECVEILNDINYQNFKLEKENGRLKVEYKELRYANDIYCESIDTLKKENEQLKKRIIELEKEVNDLSCGEADWLIEEEL